MNWDWLIGFIEGEGCFSIGLKKTNYKKASSMPFRPIPIFVLPQSKSNGRVLYRVKKFLGYGEIYDMVFDNWRFGKIGLRFQVISMKDCSKL